MGEIADGVDSRVSSWALSSSPGVDEIVEDAGRRQGREDRGGMCHSLSVKPGGTKGSRRSCLCLYTRFVFVNCGYSFFSMLSSTSTRFQKVGEGDVHFYVFETGVTNLQRGAKGLGRLQSPMLLNTKLFMHISLLHSINTIDRVRGRGLKSMGTPRGTCDSIGLKGHAVTTQSQCKTSSLLLKSKDKMQKHKLQAICLKTPNQNERQRIRR